MALALAWARTILMLVLLGVGSCNCSKICIVGSGIGGASTAHFLRKYSQEGMEIHVFERNSAVGGRMAMVELGGDKFEAGGSILHPKNLYTLQYTELLGLKRKSGSDDTDFGIWDGQKFVLKTYPSSGKVTSFLNDLLLFWRYGTSLFKMQKYVSSLLSKFLHYYDDSRPIFYSAEEMLKWADLYGYTMQSLEAELVAAGLSSRLISELITGRKMEDLKIRRGTMERLRLRLQAVRWFKIKGQSEEANSREQDQDRVQRAKNKENEQINKSTSKEESSQT